MLPWYTGKPVSTPNSSHINMCVFDSRWEANEAFELDRSTCAGLGEERSHWI